MAYVRTVKTSSGATAVQIVWSSRRGSRSIEHLGSAHDEAALAALKAAAAQRLAAGQAELDLGVAARAGSEPLPITSTRCSHLWDALRRGYGALGFDQGPGADEVFSALVLARIIEPTSKLDSLRVLQETGVAGPTYPTLNRRLPAYAKPGFRQALSTAYAGHAQLGPASLVLYEVSTLYFETTPVMGSASRDSPRNDAWNPKSPSGSSPTPVGSRWLWRPSRATEPRPRQCCR